MEVILVGCRKQYNASKTFELMEKEETMSHVTRLLAVSIFTGVLLSGCGGEDGGSSPDTNRSSAELNSLQTTASTTGSATGASDINVSAVYIDPNGSDTASGTKDAPKATLQSAISAAIQSHFKEVILKAGTYYLNQPVRLDSTASDLYIHTDSGAKVIVSGSRPLTGLKWEVYKGSIMMANVAGASFDQLFADGVQQHLARFPNYQPSGPGVVFNGSTSRATLLARVGNWGAISQNGYLHGMTASNDWASETQSISISAGQSPVYGPRIGNNRVYKNRPIPGVKFVPVFDQNPDPKNGYIEGALYELDAPGEWYLDSQKGILYFYPPAGMDLKNTRFEGTTTENLIAIQGSSQNPVKNIRIDGLIFTKQNYTFSKTTEPLLRSDTMIYRGGAIFIEGAENIQITNNVFRDLGGNAIFFSGYNRKSTIATNEIYNIGANGIALVGRVDAVRAIANSTASPPLQYNDPANYANLDMTPGPKTDNYPAYITVTDNLIHDIGQKEKQVAGVEISMASKITVDHNSIYNTPRAGINIGDGTWGGHLIEYNDVFNTVLETSDHGSLNAWGRDRYWSPNRTAMDAEIKSNPDIWKLDAVDTTVIQFNRLRCDHGWSIDLDDGTSNTIVQSNVLIGTSPGNGVSTGVSLSGGLKFREGFARVGRNNIIINNSFFPQVWFKDSKDIFANNIVMGAHIPYNLSNFGENVDSNLFMTSADLKSSQALRPGAWDVNSVFGNPKFHDPSAGNYNVPTDLDVISKINFVPFDTTNFGVKNISLKARAQVPSFPELNFAGTSSQTSDKTTLLGATVESIIGEAAQSAFGIGQNAVKIDSVQAGSLAALAGLQGYDAVTAATLNGKLYPIQSVGDLSKLIVLANGADLKLDVSRNQSSIVIALKTK